MSKKKQRIETAGGSALAADNPFANLDMGNLPEAKKPVETAPKKEPPTPKVKKTRVEIRRLKAGKGGKVVTEIVGLHVLGEPELQRLGKSIKASLGTGGTVKSGVIEIQGDKRDGIEAYLVGLGYRPVRTGG